MDALDLSWITPRLAVGGSFPLRAVAALAKVHGVRAVVDLRSEARDDEAALARAGLAFLHLPTEDQCAISVADLERGVAFVTEHKRAGERVLVHCQHGIGRSVLLALCVLTSQGMAPMEALRLAKDRREICSPSRAQHQAWAEWLQSYKDVNGGDWDPPDFDSFGTVAYRHLQRGA